MNPNPEYIYLELHERPDLFPKAATLIFEEWQQEFNKYYMLNTPQEICSYLMSIPCFASLIDDNIQDITIIEEKDWILDDLFLSPWLSNIIVKTRQPEYTKFITYVLSRYAEVFRTFNLYCWSSDPVLTEFYKNLGFQIHTTLDTYKYLENVNILKY